MGGHSGGVADRQMRVGVGGDRRRRAIGGGGNLAHLLTNLSWQRASPRETQSSSSACMAYV